MTIEVSKSTEARLTTTQPKLCRSRRDRYMTVSTKTLLKIAQASKIVKIRKAG